MALTKYVAQTPPASTRDLSRYLDAEFRKIQRVTEVVDGIQTGILEELANIAGWEDYTPVITLVGGAGNTVPVYTIHSGRWTRTGNLVTVAIELSGDGGAEGAGTGFLFISLPVSAGASMAAANILAGRIVNNTLRGILIAQLTPSTNTFSVQYFDTISTIKVATGADQNSTTRGMSIHFSYEVDA